MMIEERVATRSRGRLLNAGDGASALALGTDARGERCAYRVRRASVPSKQWGGRNGTSCAQISAHSPNIAIYEFE